MSDESDILDPTRMEGPETRPKIVPDWPRGFKRILFVAAWIAAALGVAIVPGIAMWLTLPNLAAFILQNPLFFSLTALLLAAASAFISSFPPKDHGYFSIGRYKVARRDGAAIWGIVLGFVGVMAAGGAVYASLLSFLASLT